MWGHCTQAEEHPRVHENVTVGDGFKIILRMAVKILPAASLY